MLLKHQNKKRKGKLEARWESALFLGITDASQEIVIGTSDGVVKSREFRKKGSEDEKWNTEYVTQLKKFTLATRPEPNRNGGDFERHSSKHYG